jgi:amino-acid N-acetyltransferase
MPATIAPASPTDLPAILDLLRRSDLPPDGLAERLATTVTAKDNGRLVGCAAVELYGESALLRSVAVDESVRGTGLGRALTAAALDLARARGAHTAYLLTETASGYFPRFGFRAITRDVVDPAVRRSVEFTTLCPASATVMRAALGPTANS